MALIYDSYLVYSHRCNSRVSEMIVKVKEIDAFTVIYDGFKFPIQSAQLYRYINFTCAILSTIYNNPVYYTPPLQLHCLVVLPLTKASRQLKLRIVLFIDPSRRLFLSS